MASMARSGDWGFSNVRGNQPHNNLRAQHGNRICASLETVTVIKV
jgi:hypothetical protein